MRRDAARTAAVPILLACLSASAVSAQAPASGAMVDSARAELDVGRHWHASLLLASPETPLGPEGILLKARAEAGYHNWDAVRELLGEVEWLDEVGDGAGWRLLGRAREAAGQWSEAAAAYERFPGDDEAVDLRRARALWRADRRTAALTVLDSTSSAAARSWLARELLEPAVEEGDTAAVTRLLARVTTEDVRDRTWDVTAEARWTANDTAGAVEAYRAVLGREIGGRRAAVAHGVVADVLAARGDTAEARRHYLAALEASPGSGPGADAAAWLVDHGRLDAGTALAAGRALDRDGDGRRALRAYDRYVEVLEDEAEAWVRVERARLMSTVSDRQAEAIAEFRELGTHPDPEIGARTLELWGALRRRQGRRNDAATIRGWLIERYPNTAAAASTVFFEGDDAHDREDWDGALARYGQVAEMAPTLSYAGLSRMRSAQILLHRGDVEGASAVFERYLEDFPSGARWEEAAYWAARTRLELGDTTGGLGHLDRLQAEAPFSYYTVLAADLLERPFTTEGLPDGPVIEPPTWLGPALAEIDLLTEAGLSEGAEAAVDALIERAEEAGRDARYALADSLNTRGRSLTGINLGWALRRDGEPWSLRLLRVVYPFPYREMVLREAREWGVDPFLLAALIRQESAWVADIVSSAGAIGLMQVMPETGRGLARSGGPVNFSVSSLETPEVNLHLGARFLVDVLERFGPELPLVLSAYNAGPTRAVRWRTFPEAGDPLRFTERIPFAETRGYVKNVTRNRRLYEALWGVEVRRAR